MANYESFYRTNHFKVKKLDEFKKAMAFAKTCSEDLNVYEDENRKGYFMICGYGEPSFYTDTIRDHFDYAKTEDIKEEITKEDFEKFMTNNHIEDSEDDIFFEVLQSFVAEDDAIIYKEAGHEKMRYIGFCGCVITASGIKSININNELMDLAREALQNPTWETKLEY